MAAAGFASAEPRGCCARLQVARIGGILCRRASVPAAYIHSSHLEAQRGEFHETLLPRVRRVAERLGSRSPAASADQRRAEIRPTIQGQNRREGRGQGRRLDHENRRRYAGRGAHGLAEAFRHHSISHARRRRIGGENVGQADYRGHRIRHADNSHLADSQLCAGA